MQTGFHAAARRGLLAALALTATTASAQLPVQIRPAAPAPDDIVVTARPEATGAAVQKQAAAISGQDEQLARFTQGVCPGVMGLPRDISEIIVHRVREDARRVGAPVAAEDNCSPNLIIAFVRDGRSRLGELQQSHGYLFSGLEVAEANALRDETGPVRAWSTTVRRTRHGSAESPSERALPVAFQGGANFGQQPIYTMPSSDSRIFSASQLDIASSVVVMDVGAIDALSVVQIADYAAMRGLARTQPTQGPAAAPTILSLFDAAQAHPYEMTPFDIVYLSSLYAGQANLPASAKIFGAARRFEKDAALAVKVSAPAR